MPVFTGNRFGFGRAESAGPSGPGVPEPTEFPTSPTNFQAFTAIWDGAPADLPLSHANSTWTAPGSQPNGYIRVVVVGGAGGSSQSSGGAGNGGLIDCLIPISPTSTERYKAIVGAAGNNALGSGDGGHGCGGGCGVDDNGTGSGGGGSAFFYAEPPANSDPAMFPMGVLIAGGGGAGNGPSNGGLQDGAAHPTINPDPIGGFDGYNRRGYNQTDPARTAFSGNIGGAGGRMSMGAPGTNSADAPWIEYGNPARARGEGGEQDPDGHGAQYGGGNGGGAGGGGFGGSVPGSPPQTEAGEDAPNGSGWGYGSQNAGGAGQGGEYPQRGGNGFTFNGVDLGGGGGGSHGSAAGGGGWGGGGGGFYECAGGSGGSGVWGFEPSQTDSDIIKPWVASGSIPVNGGTINSVMSVPTARGGWTSATNDHGYIVVMW